MTYGIYCIEHIASGKRYIGKSKNIEQRIRDHRKTAQASAEAWAKTYLASALRKHGWDSFRWWVVEEVQGGAEVLAARELFWIDEYEVFGTGFNTKRESAGVTEFTQGVKDKIADSLRGRPLPQAFLDRIAQPRYGDENAFYGKTHTEEARQKMRQANLDRWQDPEYRARMLQRPRGRGSKGYVASPETRAKQSAAKKGKPPPNKGHKYTGVVLERMRWGYAKRSIAQEARKLRGLDKVDIPL